ncbi:Voltage-gated hydrogen channel 1 [Sparganum proliferum]
MTESATTNHTTNDTISYNAICRSTEERPKKNIRSSRRCPTTTHIKSRLHSLLQHKWFNLTVVGLAGLDGLFLIVSLFLEIERLQSSDAETARNFERAKFVFECASLAVVTAFILELPLKLWIFGIRFYLTSCVETVDALVCLISFALDIYVIIMNEGQRGRVITETDEKQSKLSNMTVRLESKSTTTPLAEAAGLLILFRLWRIVRIVNAILVSVSLSHEEKMSELKRERDVALARVQYLEELMAGNLLPIPPSIQDSG